MSNSYSHYNLKSSFHSNDNDSNDQKPSRCCHNNCCRLIFVFILIILSIGTTVSLIIILYTDAMKEKALEEKKKGWIEKWNVIRPYVEKFPLGFVLGFIRNLIVLAIDRQSDV